MAHRKLPPNVLQEIRDFASQWGKIISRRAFGEAGPGTDVDVDVMEQVARAAATGVLEGTLATLLEQQASSMDKEQPCPKCHHLCEVRREQRLLAVHGGQLIQSEPVCHCPNCRRDFFPPTAPTASGLPRLHPLPVPDDR